MSAMSNLLENRVIDHIFRGATFAKPTQINIALFTTDPTDAGTGTEVTGGSYARVQVGPSDTDWNNTQGDTTGNSSGTTGLTDNAAEIAFPTATASWGVVSHVGILDENGDVLFHGALAAPKTIDSGDTFKFNAGDLDVTLA